MTVNIQETRLLVEKGRQENLVKCYKGIDENIVAFAEKRIIELEKEIEKVRKQIKVK